MSELNQVINQPFLLSFPSVDKKLVEKMGLQKVNEINESETKVLLSSQTDTRKWDTVHTVPVSLLNEAIKERKTYPLDFEFSYKKDDIDIELSVQFDPWQIIKGGGGANINILLSFGGKFNFKGSFDISGTKAVAQVNLRRFPNVLKANSGDDFVSILSMKSPGLKKSQLIILQSALEMWCKSNPEVFDKIFSTNNLNNIKFQDGKRLIEPNHVIAVQLKNTT